MLGRRCAVGDVDVSPDKDRRLRRSFGHSRHLWSVIYCTPQGLNVRTAKSANGASTLNSFTIHAPTPHITGSGQRKGVHDPTVLVLEIVLTPKLTIGLQSSLSSQPSTYTSVEAKPASIMSSCNSGSVHSRQS